MKHSLYALLVFSMLFPFIGCPGPTVWGQFQTGSSDCNPWQKESLAGQTNNADYFIGCLVISPNEPNPTPQRELAVLEKTGHIKLWDGNNFTTQNITLKNSGTDKQVSKSSVLRFQFYALKYPDDTKGLPLADVEKKSDAIDKFQGACDLLRENSHEKLGNDSTPFTFMLEFQPKPTPTQDNKQLAAKLSTPSNTTDQDIGTSENGEQICALYTPKISDKEPVYADIAPDATEPPVEKPKQPEPPTERPTVPEQYPETGPEPPTEQPIQPDSPTESVPEEPTLPEPLSEKVPDTPTNTEQRPDQVPLSCGTLCTIQTTDPQRPRAKAAPSGQTWNVYHFAKNRDASLLGVCAENNKTYKCLLLERTTSGTKIDYQFVNPKATWEIDITTKAYIYPGHFNKVAALLTHKTVVSNTSEKAAVVRFLTIPSGTPSETVLQHSSNTFKVGVSSIPPLRGGFSHDMKSFTVVTKASKNLAIIRTNNGATLDTATKTNMSINYEPVPTNNFSPITQENGTVRSDKAKTHVGSMNTYRNTHDSDVIVQEITNTANVNGHTSRLSFSCKAKGTTSSPGSSYPPKYVELHPDGQEIVFFLQNGSQNGSLRAYRDQDPTEDNEPCAQTSINLPSGIKKLTHIQIDDSGKVMMALLTDSSDKERIHMWAITPPQATGDASNYKRLGFIANKQNIRIFPGSPLLFGQHCGEILQGQNTQNLSFSFHTCQ